MKLLVNIDDDTYYDSQLPRPMTKVIEVGACKIFG